MTPASRPLRRRGLLLDLSGWRLRQRLSSEARLERRDEIRRRGPCLDLDGLDLLTGDLLFDRLQEPLPVLVLVVLEMELGRGQLADQPLGQCPLLVADLGIGPPVDLARVLDLVGEVEPLKQEPVLVRTDRDGRRLAAPRERADGDPVRLLESLDEHAVPTLAVLAGAEVIGVLEVDRVDRALRDERVDDESR